MAPAIAAVMRATGHQPGPLAAADIAAFYLPGPRALITGHAAARRPDGQIIPGAFHADRSRPPLPSANYEG